MRSSRSSAPTASARRSRGRRRGSSATGIGARLSTASVIVDRSVAALVGRSRAWARPSRSCERTASPGRHVIHTSTSTYGESVLVHRLGEQRRLPEARRCSDAHDARVESMEQVREKSWSQQHPVAEVRGTASQPGHRTTLCRGPCPPAEMGQRTRRSIRAGSSNSELDRRELVERGFFGVDVLREPTSCGTARGPHARRARRRATRRTATSCPTIMNRSGAMPSRSMMRR